MSADLKLATMEPEAVEDKTAGRSADLKAATMESQGVQRPDEDDARTTERSRDRTRMKSKLHGGLSTSMP
jgi:hypothetical protein